MKPGGYDLYAELLGHLIRDVRKDLSAPKMPFVIGVMGIGGEKEGKKAPQMHFRQAQAEADHARRVQGERGGGGDGPVLGRRPGRPATADGESWPKVDAKVAEENRRKIHRRKHGRTR